MRVALTLNNKCAAGEFKPPKKWKCKAKDLLKSLEKAEVCQSPILRGKVATYIGPRENNEDSAAVAAKRVGHEVYAMVAVADGVGGLRKGEVASQSAICLALYEFYNAHNPDESWLRAVFDRANDYVKRKAGGGATTLSIAVVRVGSGTVTVGNVGDSPIYAVTSDGQIYDTTPNKDEYNGYIVQAVGHPTYQAPHISTHELSLGALVGVTDGVSDYLPNFDILRKAIEIDDVKTFTSLLISSVKNTTRDNATVAVLRVYRGAFLPVFAEDVDTDTRRIP